MKTLAALILVLILSRTPIFSQPRNLQYPYVSVNHALGNMYKMKQDSLAAYFVEKRVDSIKQYWINPNGKESKGYSMYVFNEEGRLSKETYVKKGKVKYIQSYAYLNAKLTMRNRVNDKGFVSESNYTYTDSGRLKSLKSIYKGFVSESNYTYTDSGRLKSSKSIYKGKEYSYNAIFSDSQKVLSKEVYTGPRNKHNRTNQYWMNEEGQIFRAKKYDYKGRLKETIDYVCTPTDTTTDKMLCIYEGVDSNGNKVKEYTYSSLKKSLSKRRYVYDKNDQIIEFSYFGTSGKIAWKQSFINGKQTKYIRYTRKGESRYETSEEYNAQGFLINRYWWKSGEKDKKSVGRYEYENGLVSKYHFRYSKSRNVVLRYVYFTR